MSNIISRLKNLCASVKDFVTSRFTEKQKQVGATEEIHEAAEHAGSTQVLLSAPPCRPISKVLYNDDGTLKGTPYRNQEDVRLIKVSDFAEAYLLFCGFGNQETVTSKNRGGYERCVIDNLDEGLHFEMLVKPRRSPANSIATMSVTSASDNDVPICTIYFVKVNDS